MIGRPETYKDEYCEQIIEFMAEGNSLTAFAVSIGHHRQILYDWSKRHAEFRDAINIATQKAEAYWEKKLAFFVDQPFKTVNTQALMFLMKARFKAYREQMDVFESDDPYEEPESFRNDLEDDTADLEPGTDLDANKG